jgi:voltage-dependent potassium channel beta subunit
MKYRRLGNTGIKVSEIGLGGWLTFGNALGRDVAAEVMDEAFDQGITYFDNADVYAKGECEAMWGHLLESHDRSAYVLATKCFFPTGDAPTQRGLSRKHIVESCEGSLRRLRTSHIDVYYCHRYDPDTPLEETIAAMDDLVKQGKIIYWAFSQWTSEQIQACLELCDNEGFYKPKASQPQYNALQRDAENIFELCHSNGIGQCVYSPIAQGVLTGKYKPGQPIPGDSRAKDDRQNQFIGSMVNDGDLLGRVAKLEPIAEENGCTMAQLALAWCLRREEVSSVIVGASKAKQLAENVEASGIILDDDIVAAIETALAQ